jgi:hypothetical protein
MSQKWGGIEWEGESNVSVGCFDQESGRYLARFHIRYT